eukprot:1389471-Amorphochlora_amoeboformis.AAC.2
MYLKLAMPRVIKDSLRRRRRGVRVGVGCMVLIMVQGENIHNSILHVWMRCTCIPRIKVAQRQVKL